MTAEHSHGEAPSTPSRTVSRDQFLQLVGLLTLGRDHQRQIDAIERAMSDVVGEPRDDLGGGHVADTIYGRGPGPSVEQDVRDLLSRLSITVDE